MTAPSEQLPGDSYWVIPGQVLAGPYPGDYTESASAEKLGAFLDVGVTVFLDLTEADEGLEPYAAILERVASERGIEAAHRRMPICDMGVPEREEMTATLALIAEALAAEEVVYVHCLGGMGRTGTAVGCLLVGRGAEPMAALEEIKELRQGTIRAAYRSPQTARQHELVLTWGA